MLPTKRDVHLDHKRLSNDSGESTFIHVILCDVPQIDLRGAPLKAKMKGFQRNTKGLMEYLKKRDDIKRIKVSSGCSDGLGFIAISHNLHPQQCIHIIHIYIYASETRPSTIRRSPYETTVTE